MNERSKIFSVTITPRGIDFLFANSQKALEAIGFSRYRRTNFYHAVSQSARAVP